WWPSNVVIRFRAMSRSVSKGEGGLSGHEQAWRWLASLQAMARTRTGATPHLSQIGHAPPCATVSDAIVGQGNGVRVYQPLPAGCLSCKEPGTDDDADAATGTPPSVKAIAGHTITARSHHRHASYCRSPALLGIICRQPALRPQADQDVLGLPPTRLLDEAIALLRAEIA